MTYTKLELIILGLILVNYDITFRSINPYQTVINKIVINL